MAFTFKQSLKRSRRDEDDFEDLTVNGTWSRFLVVEPADPSQPLTKLTPFAIQRGFEGISSKIQNVKKLRNGSFLVECPTQKISTTLLNWNGKKFVDRFISVTPHKALNTCKGVLRCSELKDVDDEEILEGLKSQGVTEVTRVMRKKDGEKIPTNTFFLTFALPKLPEKVKIGYLFEKISLFVPAPLRCFKCQKFGHSQGRCRKEAVCERCGHQAHDNACSQKPSCPNCNGDHPPSSRQCPTFLFEKEVQKIKTEQKVSFAEAKKKVEVLFPKTGTSYAKAVKQKLGSSQGVQVGQPLPDSMIEQMRRDFCKKKVVQTVAPAKTSEQGTGTTQPSAGSSTSAPAHQAAEAKQAPKSAGQASKPAPPPKPSSLTPTPARQEVRVDVHVGQASRPATTSKAPPTEVPARQETRVEVRKKDSRNPTPSQQEVRPGLTDFFYKADKYLPKGKSSQRLSPDRLKKAERDIVHANFFDCLSDNSWEITSEGEEMDH